MAKKSKTASRKVRDKWRAKEWYKVYAPPMFNKALLGETPSADPASLIGRTTEATVHDLTGDFSKMHVKILFKVNDVRGFDAHTVFVGHDLTSDYVRRLTRRKRTKTDHVVDVRTRDGYLVRVKTMSITESRIQSSQESALRSIMAEELHRMVPEMTLSEMVKSIISGDMAKELAKVSRVIIPVKRVEVRKTEVLEMGTPIEEEVTEEAEVSEEEITELGEEEEGQEEPAEEELGDQG